MEQAIDDEIGVLIAACQRCPAHVVLVTNEVGMGIVPENRLARHFRDIAGRVNQRLAAAADAVWLVVSGIGVKSNNSIAGWPAWQGFCMQNLNAVLRAIPARRTPTPWRGHSNTSTAY